MNESVYRILRFTIELIKLSLVFYGILEYGLKNKLFFTAALAVSFALIPFSHIISFSIFIFAYGICGILIVSLAAGGSKKILYGVLSYISICMLDVITFSMLLFLTGTNIDDFENNRWQSIFTNSFSIIIILTVILIKYIRKKTLKTAIQRVRISHLLALIAVALACILSVTAVQFINLETWNIRAKNIAAVLLSLGEFLFIAICVAIVIINNSKRHFRELSIMNERIIKQQEEYYITLMHKNDEMEKFKHDINNHLFCMNALMTNKKYDELEIYLKKISKKISDIDFKIVTGNELVNVIINSLMKEHEASGIKVRWTGKFPAELNISNTDICTIFSNLLANAFEAAKSCEENRFIEVIVKTLNTNLFISIVNSFSNRINFVNGEFITTKSDKYSHGFGLKNVNANVERLNGLVEYDTASCLFAVNVTIPNILKMDTKETYVLV